MAIILFFIAITVKFTFTEISTNLTLNYTVNVTKYDWGSQAQHVESINNLNTILDVFTEEHCLVVVNNYVKINIVPTSIPIMLKQIELADLYIYKPKESWTKTAWIPTGISNLIGNFTISLKNQQTVVLYPCPMSNLYTPFTNIKN